MPSAAATPTLCPGTPGSAPTPCTAAQVEELAAKAALYLEAEQVFRRFFEEDGKLAMAGQKAGGPVMELIAGPFVESYTTERQELAGVTTTGYGEVAYLRSAPAQTHEGSDIALSVCVDGRNASAFRDGRLLGALATVQATFYFKQVNGQLKIWWRSGKKVTAC